MEIDKAKAFYLPDGSYIEVSTSSGKVNAHEGDTRDWKSVDILLHSANGCLDLLCSVEFEDGKGLRAVVYDSNEEDPVYVRQVMPDPEVTK